MSNIFTGKIKKRSETDNMETWWDSKNRTAKFKGDKIPPWYAKFVNIINGDELPVVLFLGKPGTGKTEACARLGYDMHHKLKVCRGDFTPEDNIHYDNVEFFEAVQGNRRKAQIKPDVNVTMNALDYNNEENRVNEETIHLSRTFGNPLIYDGQYWDRVPKPVRENHTFRLVAVGGSYTYAFKVYYINRATDEDEENEALPLGVWKPERPPVEYRDYIEEKDEEWKEERLASRIEDIKVAREEERQKSKRLRI